MLSRPGPQPRPRRRRRPERTGAAPEGPSPRVRRAPPAPRRPCRGRGVLVGLVGLILLWLSRGVWWPAPPPPQMILVLGGDADREAAAARLARTDGLPVVVTGGTNPEYAHWLFQQKEGLPSRQVQLDYRARDTVSNFTSLVDDLRKSRIRHALLVTSTDHMERALLVGRIVAGSRGIHLTPVPVPCGDLCVVEGRRRLWGDGARAALWVISGRDIRPWVEERVAPWLEKAGFR
ncbi:YdcF family protein [Synechococcus sp. CS-1332]|uniref:YdcF family protein n=1 Tax=Synechococcus sp. CS-1332 TaxID=2847972 RepID=UPI00223BC6F2|nr:YdcF family protein [Synechococcus sp. CS-1332]MCT0206339.1 YdcF family protein [Synechococcus sp. CS-1332]